MILWLQLRDRGCRKKRKLSDKAVRSMETLCVLEVQKKPTPATLGYQASSISEDHQTGSNQSE